MRHWIHPLLSFHAVDQEVNGERKNINGTLLIIAVFGTVLGFRWEYIENGKLK
jgi:hypothetical protein